MKNNLLMIITLISVLTLPCSGRTYGVFVGIGKYEQSNITDVPSCRYDVEAIYNIYCQAKPKGSYVTLYDEDATEAKILESLEEQCKRATAKDTVVFMFSGHGLTGNMVVRGKNKANYGLLGHSKVRNILHNCPAKRKTVIMMCCHSGSMIDVPKQQSQTQTNDRSTWQVVQEKSKKSNAEVVVLVSSRPYQYSYGSYLGTSPFISKLKRALAGEADKNNDGVVSIREVYEFVGRHSYLGAQTPQLKGRFNEKGSFL